MFSIFCVGILSLFAPAILQATEKPVVLSMCTVSDYTSPKRFDATSALRFQIVSKLVQSQDCVMVCRSMSDCLTFEQEILQLKALDAGKEGANATLAADYAIRIHLRKTDDLKGVRVFAIIKDLRHNLDLAKEPDRVIWDLPLDCIGPNDAVREYNKLADSISFKIAEHLKLPPRSRSREVEPGAPSAPLWAVLPFETLDGIQAREELSTKHRYWMARKQIFPEVMLAVMEKFLAINCGVNSDLSLSVRSRNAQAVSNLSQIKDQLEQEARVTVAYPGISYVPVCELALQGNGVNNVVDRSAIDKILKELKLRTLLGVNENLGGSVSRLLGADRLILGCVVKESGGFRILLQLVDSATSSVIDSGERFCLQEIDVENAVKDTVKDFVQSKRCKSNIIPSTKAQRHAEGRFYFDYFPYASSKSTSAYQTEWLDRSKIAYYLLRDDETAVTKTIVPRFEAIVDQCASGLSSAPDVAESATFHLEWILSSLKDDATNSLLILSPIDNCEHPPLLTGARSFLSTHHFDKALALVLDHRKKHPASCIAESMYLEAFCQYGLENVSEAARLMRLALEQKDFGNVQTYELAVDIARDSRLKDEDLEYLALQKWSNAKQSNTTYTEEWHPSRLEYANYVRFFQMTERREGAEKALLLPHDASQNAAILKGDILLKMGKFKEAAEMYAIRQSENKAGVIQARSPYVDEQLAQIKTASGLAVSTAVPLTELPSIMKFPDRYKIYCYPMTGTSQVIVDGVAARIGKRFGTKVTIQPQVTFPKSDEYDKIQECYNLPDLSRRVFKEVKISEDAVLVYFVAPVIFVPSLYSNSKGKGAPEAGNPAFTSQQGVRLDEKNQSSSRNEGLMDEMASIISWNFLAGIVSPASNNWDGGDRILDGKIYYNVAKCDVEGCGWFNRAVLCPKCAKEYSLTNFEKAHQALQTFMSRADKALNTALTY